MNDLLALDDLERAEALLDQIDDAAVRLERDIARSEAIGLAVTAVTAREGAHDTQATIDMIRYVAELEASAEADLIAVAALLRHEVADAPDAASLTRADVVDRLGRLAAKGEIARLGLLDAPAFTQALSREVTRHLRNQDSLGLFVVEFDDALEVEDELRLVRALHALAAQPGDVIGRASDNGYAVMIPWLALDEARTLLGTFGSLVRGALPERVAAIGMTAAIPSTSASASRFAWPTLSRAPQPLIARARGHGMA